MSRTAFYNVVSAAESFHRLRFPNEVTSQKEFDQFIQGLIEAVPEEHREWLGMQLQYSNEPRLRRRLRSLARYASPVFTSVCGKRDRWVTVVVEVRNRMTHHDKDRQITFKDGDLYFLAESVFLLVMLCLLRECGVNGGVLAGVGDSMSVQFLRLKLAEIIPRLYPQVVRR